MSETAPTQAGTRILGALALELAPHDGGHRTMLPQAGAGTLGEKIAHDLAAIDAEAAKLEMVAVGAHYDAVELLRPGWPLHRELEQLATRAPGGRTAGEGRIVMFGAHDDKLPDALAPSPDYLGGPLRLLPFVLNGDVAVVARVGAAFERDLIERGMAGADTALLVQEQFGLRIEHARYLTLHDLAAMMALQYEHAGLAPLWPLIETALLSPHDQQWLDAPPEPMVHYVDGEARIVLFTANAWRARYAADAVTDCERLERSFEQFQARQRQFAAVLGAHGIAVNFVHCDAEHDPDL